MAAPTKGSATLVAVGTSLAAYTQKTGGTATRSGTTATYTFTSHGLSNGDVAVIGGFPIAEFNGVFAVGNVTANTFDVTLKQDPGANPSGSTGTLWKGTLGTPLDLTTKFDAFVVGKITNGATAPNPAARMAMGFAIANNAYDYIWRDVILGSTTNVAETPVALAIPPSALWANVVFYGATGQAVDVEAVAHYVDGVA
jgi:hypothetical protein